ncbi:MAG: hypothetical protein IJW83_03405 [Clostridia bacterium]|nr:hypothetical protein [Clostridia bacterium]
MFKDYLYEYKDDGDEVDGAFLIYEALDGACRVLEADKKNYLRPKKRRDFRKIHGSATLLTSRRAGLLQSAL